MASFNLAVLPGDGIGPDVTDEGIKVLKAVGEKYGHSFNLKNGLIGGIAIDETGEALTKDCLKMCKQSDAVLLGAVGGPKWDGNPAEQRPERGLLRIRAEFVLFCNLRPIVTHPALHEFSPLRPERLQGVDLMMVRELTSGDVVIVKRAPIPGYACWRHGLAG